ncbi:hypothetical protein BKA61DRAFT_479955, partial [Leptodontidium sp. MPI-SDFR-AT-0119]
DQQSPPSISASAAHLELLDAFLAVKQKVLTSNALDRAFSIMPKDKLVTVGRKRTRKADPTFQQRRLVKWPIYVRIAAARFLRWWDSLEFVLSDGKILFPGYDLNITENCLPPLDVLMVWHAFMLNPSKYEEFCRLGPRPNDLSVNFPWTLVERKTSILGKVDLFESLVDHQSHSATVRTGLAKMVSTNGRSPLEVRFSGLREIPPGGEEWTLIGDLGSAVERQGVFVEKMWKSLWLRSSALQGTLDRATTRYERFLQLFKKYPGKMLVPTLDIDLIWHTHQCFPKSYQTLCEKEASRKFNHDDSLPRTKLKDGFKETCLLYEAEFKEEYNICLCWNCEAVRSELEKCYSAEKIDFNAIGKRVKDDVNYHKAVQLDKVDRERLEACHNIRVQNMT